MRIFLGVRLEDALVSLESAGQPHGGASFRGVPAGRGANLKMREFVSDGR